LTARTWTSTDSGFSADTDNGIASNKVSTKMRDIGRNNDLVRMKFLQITCCLGVWFGWFLFLSRLGFGLKSQP
jgi:hypothetical protein